MIVLGISGAMGHEPAAALVVDGQPVAIAEEERFSRLKGGKHQAPASAAAYCLASRGLNLHEVDVVATAWDPEIPGTQAVVHRLGDALFRHEYFRDLPRPKTVHVDHHLAHAAASFYPSGFEEAAILIVDAQGETASTMLAVGRGRDIEVLDTFDATQSLGHLYSSASRFLGIGKRGEGRMMGLAGLGKARIEMPGIELTDDGYRLPIVAPRGVPAGDWFAAIRSQWLEYFSKAVGSRRIASYAWDSDRAAVVRSGKNDTDLADFAASVQQTLERTLVHLAGSLARRTGMANLVLGGGVALNCSANGKIRASGEYSDQYIFPAANDAGGALGAALYASLQNGAPRCAPIDHAFWGPEFSDAAIRRTLDACGLGAQRCDDVAEAATELMLQGRIVGWFQGRMEVGPRALGHRSILGHAGARDTFHKINTIKSRETWRPVAPSMLPHEAGRLLTDGAASPFMLEARMAKPETTQELPAIVHVDSTTRPQTVTETASPSYHRLLSCLEEATGYGVVANSSFNNAHEPIVCTPLDAVRTFFSSPLDALCLGNFLLKK